MAVKKPKKELNVSKVRRIVTIILIMIVADRNISKALLIKSALLPIVIISNSLSRPCFFVFKVIFLSNMNRLNSLSVYYKHLLFTIFKAQDNNKKETYYLLLGNLVNVYNITNLVR